MKTEEELTSLSSKSIRHCDYDNELGDYFSMLVQN